MQALAQASINVAERKGLSASLDPAVVDLAAPGTKDFLIKVKNTGNVEDAYSATISQVTGPVSASLQGLDGNPAQTIPVFRLPALADGSLTLSLSLNATGTGIVKVLVTSSQRTIDSTGTDGATRSCYINQAQSPMPGRIRTSLPVRLQLSMVPLQQIRMAI